MTTEEIAGPSEGGVALELVLPNLTSERISTNETNNSMPQTSLRRFSFVSVDSFGPSFDSQIIHSSFDSQIIHSSYGGNDDSGLLDFHALTAEEEKMDEQEQVLEREQILRELGVHVRPRQRRAPPPTPIVSQSIPSLVGIASAEPSPAVGFFNPVSSSLMQKDLPTFVHNVGAYPISNIFANCFQQELEKANKLWLDENGDFLPQGDTTKEEAKAARKRMRVLSDSIAFLDSVVPPGR